MAYQDWVSLINDSHQAIGAGTVLNTVTTATISPVAGGGADVASVAAGAQPGGFYQGMLIDWLARGFLTTTATSTTATWLLAARVGNTGATYVTLATTAGITTPASAITGIQWKLTATSRVTAVAAAGATISTQGELSLQGITTAPALEASPVVLTGIASVAAWVPLPAISGETAASVDTTQLQGLSLRATLAGANATIQQTQWVVLAMN